MRCRTRYSAAEPTAEPAAAGPASTVAKVFLAMILLGAAQTADAAPTTGLDEAAEKEWVGGIVGPEKFPNNCTLCHALEAEAWKQTRHYATFKDRHRSTEAKAILKNMGIKSMKRSTDCRQCHYTSILKSGKVRANWGVSCESCHGPAKNWVTIHNTAGGKEGGQALGWGTGKNETKEQRQARRGPAETKGMIHTDMTYHIAANCYGCHTVPNENLVNVGKHKAGSDFDLVAWSQGEVRHNFATSPGAPDNPTNAPSSAEQKRRLYVVGAMVDLEFSLRNLAGAQEKGGDFHKAMTARVNRSREKVDAILKAVQIAEIAPALEAVPSTVDESTTIDAGLPDKVGSAARAFAAKHDGSKLGAVDGLIPTKYKGKPHKE